jgi:malate/lactate dehydrogenase
MSIPSVLNHNGIQRHLFMELSDDEIEMFRHSGGVLKDVIGQLGV